MSARRFTIVVALVSGFAVTLAAVAVAAGSGGGDREPVSLAHLKGVNFVNSCRFSHRAGDDPIVFPGRAGQSHDHSFVGAQTTNAFSTHQTLLASPSTCDREGHTAAYWLPTLMANGAPVAPRGSTIYYRRKALDRVRAFPPDLRVIAGDANARVPQDRRVTFWSCGLAGGMPRSSSVPSCPSGRRTALRLHVRFPSCWDGKNLDSADHKLHVAYPRRGTCPVTHPVATPEITIIYRYPPLPEGTTVELASGGQYSAHADFVNAWDQGTLEQLVNGCLNKLRHCGRGS